MLTSDTDVVTDHDLDLFFMIEELEDTGCEHSQHNEHFAHGGPVRRAVRYRKNCCAHAIAYGGVIKWVCDGFWTYIGAVNVTCRGCGQSFSQKDYEVVMTREV